MKIIKVYKLKKMLYILTFILVLTLLLVFSKENFNNVKKSIAIFFASVLPSLFPFILFTEIVLNTHVINTISKYLGKIISKIFKTSPNSTAAIVIGFLCGFPMGATSVTNLLESGKINKIQAEKLLTFVNNCNPAFILSTVGIGIFSNIQIGLLLLISHYVSAIILGIIFSRKPLYNIIHKNEENLNRYYENNNNLDKKNAYKSFFDIVKSSIVKAFFTLDIILGFMIIFNLIYLQLNNLLNYLNVNENISLIISGIFEMTAGCVNIFSTNFSIYLKIYLISFTLGFSGLCVICQIYSVITKYNFSFKNLILSKLIHGIFSAIITYILLSFTNIVDIDSISVFGSIDNGGKINTVNYMNNIKLSYIVSTFCIILILLIYYIIRKIYIRRKNK